MKKPNEIFLWIAPSMIKIKSDGSELSEDALDHSEPPGKLSRAQKNRKPLLPSMSLLRASESLTWFQPLVINTIPIMTQKKKRDNGEASQLWEHHI